MPPYAFNEQSTRRIGRVVQDYEKRYPELRRKQSIGFCNSASECSVFTITAIAGDYLTCTHVASAKTGINIAKPWLLRRSPFDGETYNSIDYTYTGQQARTADDGATTEDQLVTPDYVVGDEIVAISIGGLLLDGDATIDDVVWLDLNVDGRQWAKEP